MIWQFIIDQWLTRPFLGFGYGSFWAVGFQSPNLSASYEFIRLLTQGHNGYLDLLLVLGVLGTVLFAGFLSQLLAVLSRSYAIRGPLYIFATVTILFVLLLNVTDSSFARGTAAPWLFLILVGFMLVKGEAASRDT